MRSWVVHGQFIYHYAVMQYHAGRLLTLNTMRGMIADNMNINVIFPVSCCCCCCCCCTNNARSVRLTRPSSYHSPSTTLFYSPDDYVCRHSASRMLRILRMTSTDIADIDTGLMTSLPTLSHPRRRYSHDLHPRRSLHWIPAPHSQRQTLVLVHCRISDHRHKSTSSETERVALSRPRDVETSKHIHIAVCSATVHVVPFAALSAVILTQC